MLHMNLVFVEGANILDLPFLSTILSGATGAVIGVVGTIIGIKLQTRAAENRHRVEVARRFYTQSERIGIQAIRAMRRAESLDLPMEAGWDLSLREIAVEIGLAHRPDARRAADTVVDALTEIVDSGTVGAIVRFEEAQSKFAKSAGIRSDR